MGLTADYTSRTELIEWKVKLLKVYRIKQRKKIWNEGQNNMNHIGDDEEFKINVRGVSEGEKRGRI